MINIALDGPAGSGKSTVAKILAKKLDILYLDTGAMYRACALKCLNSGIDVSDKAAVDEMIERLDLKIKYSGGAQVTLLDGVDVSKDIRRAEISMLASTVSAHRSVRLKMVEKQREIASQMNCVLDGRDIGSFVLPNAQFKFYLTADSMVRAERRHKELKERGEEVDLNALHEEILKRDYNDSHRDFAPLVKAEDAEVIDTSFISADEVAELIINKVRG